VDKKIPPGMERLHINETPTSLHREIRALKYEVHTDVEQPKWDV